MSRKEEIERKFLVQRDLLPTLIQGTRMRQGYLGYGPTIRVRVQEESGGTREAFLTIKGEGMVGRDEFEYAIPFEEGSALLSLSQGSIVEKTRYRLPVPSSPDLTWEVDVFEGDNSGLVVAEIELESRDQPFDRPDWLGPDVTEDPAYKNAALARSPFRTW